MNFPLRRIRRRRRSPCCWLLAGRGRRRQDADDGPQIDLSIGTFTIVSSFSTFHRIVFKWDVTWFAKFLNIIRSTVSLDGGWADVQVRQAADCVEVDLWSGE